MTPAGEQDDDILVPSLLDMPNGVVPHLIPNGEGVKALVRDNTRKLYMAATRAGQRLVITYVGDVPEVIRAILVSG